MILTNIARLTSSLGTFGARRGTRPSTSMGPRSRFIGINAQQNSPAGPNQSSDFYVALVCEEEVVVSLGDYKEAYKRTKSIPALVEAVMFYEKEHVFNKKAFSTRARFDQRREEHEIVVESLASGLRDPEMWISIDGIVVIHIRNLQWKFKGSQTIFVNKQPVQVFWDVHAWLFCTPGSNHGLFIFKPDAPDSHRDKEEGSHCGDGDSDDCNSVIAGIT